MAKYRKKPVVIEACQIGQPGDSRLDLITWGDSFGMFNGPNWTFHADGGLEIVTLEGVMRANPGDWIIRGVKGEFYPCKPDIFNKTYDPVD
jgi:hypothetical protein